MSKPSLHIHIPRLFRVKPENNGWEYEDMLWCQGAEHIGLSK